MSYVFFIGLRDLNARQMDALREIDCRIEINSAHLDDVQYTRLQWILKFKQGLDLEHPKTFNEKIQWLKLRHRRADMAGMVDKIEVRNYVGARVGPEYLKNMWAVAATPEDLDFSALPESFMVKCSHGSAWNLPVPDKTAVDWSEVCTRLRAWLGINYYDLRREWVYRDIKRRILVEELLTESGPFGLLDYKVFCFGGTPRFVQVDIDRAQNHRRNFYDTEWHRIPCEVRYPPADFDAPRPNRLGDLLDMARILAADFPFLRVDFFLPGGRLLFGELTFFPGNGFETIEPPYDRLWGDWLELPREVL